MYILLRCIKYYKIFIITTSGNGGNKFISDMMNGAEKDSTVNLLITA